MNEQTLYSKNCIEKFKKQVNWGEALSDFINVEKEKNVGKSARYVFGILEEMLERWDVPFLMNSIITVKMIQNFLLSKGLEDNELYDRTSIAHSLPRLMFVGVLRRVEDGDRFIYYFSNKVKEKGLNWMSKSKYLLGEGLMDWF